MSDHTSPRMRFDVEAARASKAGQRLTARQFDRATLHAQILNREVHATASFVSELKDQVHSFCSDERFDHAKGELILRGIHKAAYGESLNDVRERLVSREAALQENPDNNAMDYVQSIERMITEGPTMPFWKALDRSGVAMASNEGISEVGAKSLMTDALQREHGEVLYVWGKDLEKSHHTPVIEAERAAKRELKQSNERTYARSGPSR
ncbi:MAG: hypothetical protein AAF092_10020 [Pseudomonadota bacterium]